MEGVEDMIRPTHDPPFIVDRCTLAGNMDRGKAALH